MTQHIVKANVNVGSGSWPESYWASRNDDHPETVWHKAWAVEVSVSGFAKWGPVTYRDNAKKEHSGVARVHFHGRKEYGCGTESEDEIKKALSDAEAYACEVGAMLELNGFDVELTFKGRFLSRVQKVCWLDGGIPKALRKRVRVEVEDLIPTMD